jgi:hypothetical protein
MTDYVKIPDLVRDYIEQSSAPFFLMDLYKYINIFSICHKDNCELLIKNPNYRNRRLCPNKDICIAKDKNNIRVLVHELCKQGKLERSKLRQELYRKIDNQLVKLDIAKAEPGVSIDLRFPLQLERFVRVMPKSLIVVAGATGAGKSAYLLNMALINVDHHPIHYFANSEMTAHRIKERVLDYEFIGQVNMDNFNAYEREDNFHDCLFPDGINIIDYVEIPSERPSIIGDYLQAINAKLTTGVAIVAIQKKTAQKTVLKNGEEKITEVDLGVGGEWSKRKATIYLTMDKFPENRLVIRKSRERVIRNIDPEDMEFKYKLVDGITFRNVQYPPEYAKVKPEPNKMPWDD